MDNINNIIGEVHSLGSTSPISTGCFVEVTINFPRTINFIRMTSAKQMIMYSKINHILKNTFGMQSLVDSIHKFEFCKGGHIHMHCLYKFKFDGKHFPVGVVADIVKTLLNLLPSKFNKFNEKLWSSEWLRYRCPAIVCQYQTLDNTSRVIEWQNYIKKCE